jgi:hypothetical protein
MLDYQILKNYQEPIDAVFGNLKFKYNFSLKILDKLFKINYNKNILTIPKFIFKSHYKFKKITRIFPKN